LFTAPFHLIASPYYWQNHAKKKLKKSHLSINNLQYVQIKCIF